MCESVANCHLDQVKVAGYEWVELWQVQPCISCTSPLPHPVWGNLAEAVGSLIPGLNLLCISLQHIALPEGPVCDQATPAQVCKEWTVIK